MKSLSEFFFIIVAVTLITLTLGKVTERSPGKTVNLKNCHCTCFDDEQAAPHPDICNATNRNVSSAYNDAEVHFVTRMEWGARPPRKSLQDLALKPATFVVISHTATKSCYTTVTCLPHIRSIQSFHIESHGWLDIGYNFLVGGDGMVYIGRGWDKQGAYTHRHHQTTIEIAFIGTFREENPTEMQLSTAKKLLEIGVRENKLAKDYKLLEHMQVGLPRTARPGDHLYDIIKTWNHFTPVDDS